jgi:hypothetical protein
MPDDLTATLDRWRAIEQAATRGPWEAHSYVGVYTMWHDEIDTPLVREVAGWDDAVFISAARSAFPLLVAAIEAVLKLHVRQDKPIRTYDLDLRCEAHDWTKHAVRAFDVVRECPDCTYRERYVCSNRDCREDEWPCPTYLAISAELTKGGDRR